MNVYEPIAIIGLSCRFPDAPDIDTFKNNLLQGHDAIRPMQAEDIEREGINADLFTDPKFINAGTIIKNPRNFDYAFFGLSPKEAELMDPQHRLFLEECRKLLDLSNLTRGNSNIGIYAGCRQSTYQMLLPALHPEQITQTETFQQLMGNDKDYLSTRASYQLNLNGPSMSLQTACSTSLVTVHQACQALRNQECDAAIAGGVGVSFPQGVGYQTSPGMIFSNDGKCRPFSADGTGIVAGNGLGIVALKRLKDAVDDGDIIHAVIKGSALSNDGKAKLGFTAPGKLGQKKAIQQALKNSGVNPNEIGLLEAHGTGTPLGDPIEIQAISEIYKEAGVPNQHCAIGSVKGNVGHLDTAAGIASLIKSVLAVRDNIMPESLHCKPLNSNISFEKTPFYPLSKQQLWPNNFSQRTAAISSFGIGGTNCHMIIQEAPEYKQATLGEPTTTDHLHILPVSNHHSDNLYKQAENYADALKQSKLDQQCRTATLKREHFSSRIALVGSTADELKKSLIGTNARTVKNNPKIAWVFSGQGSQKTGMGKHLYDNNSVFRESIELCVDLFAAADIYNIKEVLFEAQYSQNLTQTLYTQPALFTWQYAMSILLQHWGITPHFVIGHSIGEFAASVIAGHLSLASAIQLVAHRALLMENNSDSGCMLAVRINEEIKEKIDTLLKKDNNVTIASINGKGRITLSGSESSIKSLQLLIEQEGASCKLLNVNRSFHSSSMDTIKKPFYSHNICLSVPISTVMNSVPIMYSTLTATKVALGDLNTDYWFQQLRKPVQFYQTTQALAIEEPDLVIEIGPDGSFSSLLKNQHGISQHVFNDSCTFGSTSGEKTANLIAELYCLGYSAPLEKYYSHQQSSNAFAEMPGLLFSPTYCWPQNIVERTESDNILVNNDASNQASTLATNEKINNSLQLWQWQWQPLPPLYQQQLQEIKHNKQERWCIVGNTPYADNLAKAINSFSKAYHIAECHVANHPPEIAYDRLIDTRLLTFNEAFNSGLSQLKTGSEQLVAWGEYNVTYPDSEIVTLVINASDIDQPHLGNGLWAFINLCRTYTNENTRINHTCIDIGTDMELDNSSINKKLINVLQQVNEFGNVLSLRNNNLHTLTIKSTPYSRIESTINWKQKNFTLIAGLGSVGLGLATWLVDQGCKKLAFIVRQKLNIKQQQLIDDLETKGVSVEIIEASLTCSESLTAVFNKLNIVIDSVFHTAHDGIQKLHPLEDEQAFTGSLAVKIKGSQNLYHVLNKHPISLFCMFSSVTSVMAIPGASGYATANAWQDAYAAHLRSIGFPALTISWGQLMLSKESEHVTQVDKTGITALSPTQAFDVMEYLIEKNISGVSPIIYDPISLGRTITTLPATLPCLKTLLSIDNTQSKQALPDISDIHGLNAQEKEKRINHYIYQLISQKLKFTHNQLNAEQFLTEQGVDSLVFLELVQIINQQLQLNLPSTVGYEFGTVNALSAHISQQLNKSDIAFSNQSAQSQMTITAAPNQRFEPFPLTDLQQAFWIGRLDGLSMGSVSCHQYVELELENLDHKKLEAAWNKLIQRHEMMRCVILPTGQNQIIQQVEDYKVVYRDFSIIEEGECESKLQTIRDRMSFQVFNPQKWPLFELSVSKISEHISRVHLDMDLLIFDIQSFRIIYGELASLLDSQDMNETYTQLPTLTLSFRDYLLAEKKQESSAEWQQAKRFWMDRLETIPNAPELPIIKNIDQEEPAEYRTLDHRLSPTVWKKLQKNANKFGLTPSSVLLTAYTQALALYSKSSEFTLNITYFNRKNVHEQIMDVCGDFTSLMLLPVKSTSATLFSEEAKRTQKDMWDALNNRDFNGIRVMRELGRHRQTGADSIEMPVVFTSMIGMDFDDPSQPDWPLMSKQVFEINQTPQVWIDYQASEYGGALMTRWFVAKNLFEQSIIEGLFSVYTAFLELLAEDDSQWEQFTPDLRLQHEQVLYQQLHSEQPVDKQSLMPQLVQQHIHGMPNSPAIIFQDSKISYAELGEQVNSLAHYLLALGLPASSPVAVVMPKQAQSTIASLAIQAAGGCYVPINCEYDNERLQHILKELSPFAIITMTSTAENTLANLDFSLINSPIIDLQNIDTSTFDKQPPSARQTADELAYIIYTSGSTGHPKGVMLNHQMPINTLSALTKKLNITSQDRALSLCACHHDMSIFDSYGILSNGGSVIYPAPTRLYDAEHWLDLIAIHKPTIINAVPSFITILMDAQAVDKKTLPAPRHIIMGGDWIPIALVKRINALWPDCKVHSIGGPTETAIVSAHYEIHTIDPRWQSIPYGKPLANQTCYLLTTDGRDCPIGVVGEICMGEMAMSMGYWKDDKTTAQHYRHHAVTGQRLFHTGDLGILRPDGNLDIVGRIDNQINHNGLRIEPGEIEASINQHPDISEAIVIYAGKPHKQLHGFITKENQPSNNTKPYKMSSSWLQANKIADQYSRVPPKDFDVEKYSIRFNEMEKLSTWVMLAVIQSAGFLNNPQQPASTMAIVDSLRVSPPCQKILLSWIKVLINDGFIHINLAGSHKFEDLYLEINDKKLLIATEKVQETQELEALKAKISIDVMRHGTQAEQRLWSLYTRCVDKINDLLTGEFNPLSLMFENGKTDFAESHYRENIVSQHFNSLAGKTIAALLKEKLACKEINSKNVELRILEFGAGIGSVTHDILKNVPCENFIYDFTDISSYFLDNAKEMFSAWPQMRYSHFNINKDPGLQQLTLGSYDIIIGANVLHDAMNVHKSIGFLRQLLKPSGHLMLVEGTMNPRFQMVSLGFVEGLTHYEDERLKTSLPMISAPLWKQHMRQEGFLDAASFPPENHPIEKMNYHLIIAENTTESAFLNKPLLDDWLRKKLPTSMIPTCWHHLDHMPLTLNGKVDRLIMAKSINSEPDTKLKTIKPLYSECAKSLAKIWQEILNTDVHSEEDNFFSLGGDSLLMTRLSNRIQHQFTLAVDLVTLLRNPILEQQVNIIEAALLAAPINDGQTNDFEEGVI